MSNGNEHSTSPALIETKLPLWWILASVTAIVFSMGGLYSKLESVTTTLSKIETKLDNQDRRLELFSDSLREEKAVNTIQQTQIDRLGSDVGDLARYARGRTQ